MRIATVSNASVGHTRRWIEYFRGRGHTVELWSLEPGPAPLEAHHLPALPLPGLLRYPLAAPALRAALSRFAPDLVDAHFVPSYGLMAALAGRRPLAVSAWGSDLLLAADPWRRARLRFVLRRADLVLADAENLADAARAVGGSAAPVEAVPWGVDLVRYVPGRERVAGLLASTRMLEPIYDHETLLAGVAPVMARRPETRLVIAGAGSLRGSLERRARHLLPPGRFEFAGLLAEPEMASLLGRAEIYLSASRSDSTSLSLLESMAAGAVPVVSDIAGNREWVSHGEGARLFRPGDAVGLERELERALGERAWAEVARAHNRGVVERRGDRQRNMARIEARFRALVEMRTMGQK